MSGEEKEAVVFIRAFESLPKVEQRAVAARLIDDPQFREELLDIGLIRECETEPARPLEKNLSESGINEG